MILEGSEVKSVRAGGISINESYVKIINGEVFLSIHIKPFEKASSFVPDSRKTRKFLLNKNEIVKYQKLLWRRIDTVPLRVY